MSETSHATEDAEVHGKTLGAVLDAGLLEAADVVAFIGPGIQCRPAAVARLTDISGVGKTGANQIVSWLRNLGWPEAFSAETTQPEAEAVMAAQDAPADPTARNARDGELVHREFDLGGEHPDVTAWRRELRQRFPSNAIEYEFDLATPIFNAYADGRIPAITIELRPSKEEPRNYLGASSLGSECSRRAWAKHRGLHDDIDGRKLRLFRSGDAYEERMRVELNCIGFETRGQAAFSAKSDRVKGHNDDFVTIAELPLALWEAKTANRSSYKSLERLVRAELGDEATQPLTPAQTARALKLWNPKYYYQGQVYMGAWGLNVCLYEVTCKDTDDLLCFLLPRCDDAIAEAGERADLILDSIGLPPRGYSKPKTPECTRFCDAIEWCWYSADLPHTCGTCTAWRDGICTRNDTPALAVCDEYVAVPREHESEATEWEAL